MSQPVDKRAVWIVGAILFVAMVFTLPVFYYLFVVGGIMTYATLAAMSLPILYFPFDRNFFAGVLLNGTHLLVYGAIFFIISWVAAQYLCRYPLKLRAPIVGAILIMMLKVSGMEIFGYIGHGSGRDRPQNAYGMWSEVWDETSDALRRMHKS